MLYFSYVTIQVATFGGSFFPLSTMRVEIESLHKKTRQKMSERSVAIVSEVKTFITLLLATLAILPMENLFWNNFFYFTSFFFATVLCVYKRSEYVQFVCSSNDL
jgi:Na+/pantothenate symporter